MLVSFRHEFLIFIAFIITNFLDHAPGQFVRLNKNNDESKKRKAEVAALNSNDKSKKRKSIK